MTFTQWKKRIQVGTQLLCVSNTYRPDLDGQVRVVDKVQTNTVRCVGNSWTHWPKAADVTFLDEDTASWPLLPMDPDLGRLTLRILPAQTLQSAINTILNPAPGIRLTGMTMLCGCHSSRNEAGVWVVTVAKCPSHVVGQP